MRYLLFVAEIIVLIASAWAGLEIMKSADSAIHEIEAVCFWIITSISLVGISVHHELVMMDIDRKPSMKEWMEKSYERKRDSD